MKPGITARDIAAEASAASWEAERCMRLFPMGSDDQAFYRGQRNALQVLLQRCGVLPTGPFGRSVDELLGALSVVRNHLPEGFEAFTVAQAHELLVAHGVETALNEVAGLQLYLTSGRKPKHVPAAPAVELNQEALAVAAEAQDGADVHAATLSQQQAWLASSIREALVPEGGAA
jgi:hypothetical protein